MGSDCQTATLANLTDEIEHPPLRSSGLVTWITNEMQHALCCKLFQCVDVVGVEESKQVALMGRHLNAWQDEKIDSCRSVNGGAHPVNSVVIRNTENADALCDRCLNKVGNRMLAGARIVGHRMNMEVCPHKLRPCHGRAS